MCGVGGTDVCVQKEMMDDNGCWCVVIVWDLEENGDKYRWWNICGGGRTCFSVMKRVNRKTD